VILNRWRCALAALQSYQVEVPYACQVCFPGSRPRHRRDQERFFALIEASALLHQRQRMQIDGRIIATEEDFQHAERAARGLLGMNDDGLSVRGRAVMNRIVVDTLTTVTLPQLSKLMPHWTRSMLRTALDELADLDLLTPDSGGRGRHARSYTVSSEAITDASDRPSIRLLPASPGAEGIGDIGDSGFAIITPVRTGT